MSTPMRDEADVFADALRLPPGERSAFLERACGDDHALRQRIEELLQEHEQIGSFLEAAATIPPTIMGASVPRTAEKPDASAADQSGARVGPYKLLQRIGEGGMGVVYMAEQEQPVRRKVALKIIRPGMGSAQVIARFEAERQALALMDHQNIARVLDAGTTETGLPYFVMELVHGVPITRYCDENRLTPRERLELFVPVCQAIQHAHQKGIIHRDIKPSNVLVTQYDGEPVPKVIDFGVAKAVEQKLTDKTMFTQFGAVVGTLGYMAPEQAAIDAQGVDTRGDIYSLGVLLYELLTGSTPIEAQRLRNAALLEVLCLVQAYEPPRPSLRLSSTENLRAVAAARRTDPVKLSRLVRGDLDWIVMKCLEKDRTRRYDSASSLARDIEHYLNDEPVVASPPSRLYQWRKFARKHRRLLLTAAAFVLLLVAGIITTTALAIRATFAEQQAAQRRSESEAVSRFLIDAFGRLDPARHGTDLKVVDLLESAYFRLDAELPTPSLVKGDLLAALGRAFDGLANPARAVPLLEKALAIYEERLVPNHGDILNTQLWLAAAYAHDRQFDKAIPLAKETLALRQTLQGPTHRETLIAMNELGVIYNAAGHKEQARDLHEKTLALRRAHPDDEPVSLPTTLQNLASVYQDLGQLDKALPLFIEAREKSQNKLGADHPLTMTISHNLALCHDDAGQPARAIELLEAVVQWDRHKLGVDHPHTLTAMYSLADSYLLAGKPQRAVTLLQELIPLSQQKLGMIDTATLRVMANLGNAYLEAGAYAKAEAKLTETLQLGDKQWPHTDPIRASTLALLGDTLNQQNKFAEAEPYARKAVALREKQTPRSWKHFHALSVLGESLAGQKQFATAEPLLIQGHNGIKDNLTASNLWAKKRLVQSAERLVRFYQDRGKDAEAEVWRRKVKEAQALATTP